MSLEIRNENPEIWLKISFYFNFYCVLILIGVALLSCLCAAYLAFLKHGRFIFWLGGRRHLLD